MPRLQSEQLLQHIQRLAVDDAASGRSDGELLHRFLSVGDGDAFAALVGRHGAMVWRVCTAGLGQREDAEDVFQATFLVLARHAGSVRKHTSLACWLHGVAVRLAHKVRGKNLRRHTVPLDALDQIADRPMDEITWRELRQILHEELDRLPEKNRLPILLCHLAGQTQDEAARALGWSLGRLRGRLLRGRELLRGRLARRGLAPAVPLLAAALFPTDLGAAPPVALVAAVHKALTVPATGALALAEPFIRESLRLLRIKLAVTFAMGLLSALGILGLLAHLSAAVPDAPPDANNVRAEQSVPVQGGQGEPQARKDALGDPLPAEALLRLGTLRFRAGGVVTTLSFAQDGRSLLCAGWGKTMHRWDSKTGAELEHLHGPDKGFLDAAVSVDGKTLVGGTVDGQLHVWDLAAGKEIKKIAVPGGKVVRVVAVAPDGRTAVSAGDDNAVRLLDLTTGAERRVLVTYKQQPNRVAFSPDGKLVASSSYDGTAHVHAADTGKVVFQPSSQRGLIRSLAFAPDGKTLLAGDGTPSFKAVRAGDKNALSFWNTQSGQLQRRIETGTGDVATIQFAPDGKTFACGTSDGLVLIWDTAAAKVLHRIRSHADGVHALGFSPAGRALASGGSEQAVRLWDTQTGKQRNTLIGHQERVTAVAVAPAGNVVATAAWDHSIRLWDSASGKELRRFGWPPPPANDARRTSMGVHPLIFSPDGQWLVAAGHEDKVWLWDLQKGTPARTFPGVRAALSPDGKQLATAGWSGSLQLFETATGKEVRQFKGHRSGIVHVQFTPDGQSLISAGVGAPFGFRTGGEQWDRQVFWLWDVATGKVRRRFGGERRPEGVALSPDGRTLSATAMFANDVHLWEVATGKERTVLKGHGETIFATRFTPDNRFLASGSMDRTIRLWRLPGGARAHTFTGHHGWVLDLAFSPDGKKLVSSSLDTTGLIWQMPAPPAPPQAKRMPAELPKLWDDLASADAGVAYQALAALAAAPAPSARFLGAKLKPVATPDPKRLAQLVADLDSSDFTARQAAATALDKLAELAAPALRAALARPASLEAARRIEQVLETIAGQPLPPNTLRDLRAVEALDSIATRDARAVLRPLGQGAAAAHVTRDAQAALRRLGQE